MTNEIVLTGTHGWLGSRMLHALINGLPDYPDTLSADTNVRCFYREGESPVDVAAATKPLSSQATAPTVAG